MRAIRTVPIRSIRVYPWPITWTPDPKPWTLTTGPYHVRRDMRVPTLAAQRIEQFQNILGSLVPSPLGIIVACIVILLSGLFLRSAPLQTSISFSLGSADPLTARGFYDGETTEAGQSFRWTNGDGALHLPPQGLGPHTLYLTLAAPRLVEASVPLTITFNNQPMLATTQTSSLRSYQLLVPANWVNVSDNIVRIQSDTFQPPKDTAQRSLGVAVFEAEWRAVTAPPWLVPVQILVIALVTLTFYLVLRTARVRPLLQLLLVVMFVAITLAMRHSDSRFVYRWNAIATTLALEVVLVPVLVILRRYRPAQDTIAPFRQWARLHWQALLGYTAITAILLYPLLAQFTTHIIGAPGDNFEYLWKMQWFSNALLQAHVSPVFAPQIFYPPGSELTISEMSPANTLLLVPVTWLFGSTISYNVCIILSFILTAFFSYLLAQRLGASRGAAWVAGIIFAFCLRRFFHATGHFGMMGTEWLVLALYGWEGVLTRRRIWDGQVAGLGLALTTWTSWHYGTTFPFFIALYTLIRLGVRKLPELRYSWQPILLIAAIMIALILPLAQPYIEARARGETYQHLYAQVVRLSAPPQAYLLPNPFHPWWGNWARQLYPPDRDEQYVALGYSVMLLALVGIWIGRKQRVVQALTVLMIINIVMSFGPELRLSDTTSLSLPARFVYNYVPILDGIRNWSRMAMYVALCAALLASLALTALPRRWRKVGVGLASALILLESVSVLPLSATGPRPVDLWLHTI